jgi:hypothetical protein
VIRLAEQGIIAHLLRLWRVVVKGRTAVLLVSGVCIDLAALLMGLIAGEDQSEIVKLGMFYPLMLLIVISSVDVVSTLRTTGDLELGVTLASPARMIAGRLAPPLMVAVVMVPVVGLFLVFFMEAWQVALGMLQAALPLALAVSACLYWNLRLRSAGTVMFATIATLVPAMICIGNAEIFRDSGNVYLSTWEIVASAVKCQVGLLLLTAGVAALALRRLSRAEELLDEG